MQRSNSNPTTSLTKRRSFRGWLKRVTLPNGNQRKVGPDSMPKGKTDPFLSQSLLTTFF